MFVVKENTNKMQWNLTSAVKEGSDEKKRIKKTNKKKVYSCLKLKRLRKKKKKKKTVEGRWA